MVTKATRDVLDVKTRAITDGIIIDGNCSSSFAVNGTTIGLSTPCDGAFVNLAAIDLTVTGMITATGATLIGFPFLDLAGGTMTGDIDMGNNQINALVDPTLNQDAATKAYVDASAGGSIIQVVNTPVSAQIITPFNPSYPFDNTPPQQTLDTGFLLAAFDTVITPTSATNLLKIEVTVCWTQDNLNTGVTFAVFQDSIEDALVAMADNNYPSANFQQTTGFIYYMLAGTTSPTTFKLGFGQNGSAGTSRINGNVVAGGPLYGGACVSHMTVTEISV